MRTIKKVAIKKPVTPGTKGKGIEPPVPAEPKKRRVLTRKMDEKVPVVQEDPQERRFRSLTKAQQTWDSLQWDDFLSEFSFIPSDECTQQLLDQLNYGRVYMRNEREKKALEARIKQEELQKQPVFPREVTNNAERIPIIDPLQQQVAEMAAKKQVVSLQTDDGPVVVMSLPPRDAPATEPMPDRPPFVIVDIDKQKEQPSHLMWEQAEELARQGKREEWKKLGFQMQLMIEHAYDCIVNGIEVTRIENLCELLDGPPIHKDQDPQSIERRTKITARFKDYWAKRIEKAEPGFDKDSKSYRIKLAKRTLQAAIERYAVNWKFEGGVLHVADNVLEDRVKTAAVACYKAHLPIPKELIKPGPISNIDPDYIEYHRICRDYGITVGQFLHEAIL